MGEARKRTDERSRNAASFRRWMAQVDAKVIEQKGLSVYHLPQCEFREWHDGGMPVGEAAGRAIRQS